MSANTNYKTVQRRTFKEPMTWASDEQLDMMRVELIKELRQVHKTESSKARTRNGLKAVEREITWRNLTLYPVIPLGMNASAGTGLKSQAASEPRLMR